jgi:hypothetical protein
VEEDLKGGGTETTEEDLRGGAAVELSHRREGFPHREIRVFTRKSDLRDCGMLVVNAA